MSRMTSLHTDLSAALFPRTLLLSTLGVRLLKYPARMSSKETHSHGLFEFDLPVLPAFFPNGSVLLTLVLL